MSTSIKRGGGLRFYAMGASVGMPARKAVFEEAVRGLIKDCAIFADISRAWF